MTTISSTEIRLNTRYLETSSATDIDEIGRFSDLGGSDNLSTHLNVWHCCRISANSPSSILEHQLAVN